MIDEYLKALRAGQREYKAGLANSKYPYLSALDDVCPGCDALTHRILGLIEIPVDLIAGTKTRARQSSFAPNYMPLLDADTEFAIKWVNLYKAQLKEGFNDPIKVLEYLHDFYVIEGNKRVSVSRFLEMPTIAAEVIRLMPTEMTLRERPEYEEFLGFYDVTGIYDIKFSKAGMYNEVAEMLGEDFHNRWPEEKIDSLKTAFWKFKLSYDRMCTKGKDYDLPTSDAFMTYLRIYIKDAFSNHSEKLIESRINKIKKELLTQHSSEKVALVESAEHALNAGSLISKTVSKTGSAVGKVIPKLSYSPKHPLKAAFIYDRPAKESSWIADHERGRLRMENAYGGTVITACHENCNSSAHFELAVEQAHNWGADVIFTTSAGQINDTLRAAIQYEDTKFLNCSINLAHHAVRTYYAKQYEAKFLAGLIAGIYSAQDGTNLIGYCSDYPIYGTIASINAFAIGAAMTNPKVTIYLDWYSKTDSNWWWDMLDKGAHVISAVDSLHNVDGSNAYGLCFVEKCEPGRGNDLSKSCLITNLATPIWKWGKLYEIIIKTIIDGTYNSRPVDVKDRATNYWWGMISGVVDIELSEDLPSYTKQLVNVMRDAIIGGHFNPFDGELRSQDKVIRRVSDSKLSSLEIIQMDWLNENVVGEIPRIESLKEDARTTVKISGVDKSKGDFL